MGGSKKGEHRGNARKRAKGSPHERPRDVMREAVQKKPSGRRGGHGQAVATIERRIQIARLIHGQSGSVLDMTPKEVLLAGMHHNMQGVRDWQDFLMDISSKPITEETIRLTDHAEREIERLLDKAAEHAHRVLPVIHPRLSAIALAPSQGDNPVSILQDLLDEVDERQRAEPIMIEHVPKKRTA